MIFNYSAYRSYAFSTYADKTLDRLNLQIRFVGIFYCYVFCLRNKRQRHANEIFSQSKTDFKWKKTTENPVEIRSQFSLGTHFDYSPRLFYLLVLVVCQARYLIVMIRAMVTRAVGACFWKVQKYFNTSVGKTKGRIYVSVWFCSIQILHTIKYDSYVLWYVFISIKTVKEYRNST